MVLAMTRGTTPLVMMPVEIVTMQKVVGDDASGDSDDAERGW
jgi:hypothetical protein